ncbi:phage protein [Proteus hauseri ZMd44]|nr:phage protein [Proteus hauseri ZMd44]
MRDGRFVYEIKVPEGYEETNYQFMRWLVDDFNLNRGLRAGNEQ